MKILFGITPKLTLILVLFAGMLLASVGTLAYESGLAALQEAVTAELLSTAIEKQAAINEWVHDRQTRLSALAVSPSVIAQLTLLLSAQAEGSAEPANAQVAHDQLVRNLQTWVGPDQAFLGLLVMEYDSGKVIAATDSYEEGTLKEDRPFFINGKYDSYVQNPYYSITLQSQAMTVSTPLVTADGRRLGVLAGRLNLAEMNSIIARRTSLRQSDDAYVVNTSNLFITQPRFISDPVVLQRGIHTEDVQNCLEHTSGVIVDTDYRGVPAIAVYRWLPERELCLVVKIDQAEALAPARLFGQTILLIGGLTLLAALGLAVGLARTVTRPILALQSGAARLGQGEHNVRLPETSEDELGQLAREFNRMASAIAEKEAQLHQRAEQLTQANRELESFSYSVSHDLRAPLRSIDGFSRILLEEYAPQLAPEAQRYLRVVRDNTQQMGHLIDDLLSFARLSRQALTMQPIDPAELVRQVLTNLESEQAGRRVEIILGDLPMCQGDPALLKQVFVNLLANALKFTRQREPACIEVGSQQVNEACVYFIKDNGAGFDMQYAAKLFGVFQRLHRPEEYEGTGVGLAIVQRVIIRHGGRIWAEAEVDKGAVFYFTLPRLERIEATPPAIEQEDSITKRARELI